MRLLKWLIRWNVYGFLMLGFFLLMFLMLAPPELKTLFQGAIQYPVLERHLDQEPPLAAVEGYLEETRAISRIGMTLKALAGSIAPFPSSKPNAIDPRGQSPTETPAHNSTFLTRLLSAIENELDRTESEESNPMNAILTSLNSEPAPTHHSNFSIPERVKRITERIRERQMQKAALLNAP